MAVQENAAAICGNPDCRVAETGRCIEGLDLSACPDYGHEAEETVDSSQEGEGKEGVSASIALPRADSLNLADASRMLRRGTARVIAIVGARDAGKTSLIASLYDLLQENPICGIRFAQSQTLHAFELACHDARAASRRTEPHTYRTPRGGVSFYHLNLSGGEAGDSLTLLMGDRAGEEYQSVADNVSLAGMFPEVRRADSIAVLVDGRRLVDTVERHNLLSEVSMMLQGLNDGGAFLEGQRLALVLTKTDVVRESSNASRADANFASLKGKVKRHFGEVFSTIEAFEIAAAPKDDTVPRGTGIPALLKFWLEAMERRQPQPELPPARRPGFARAFARVLSLDD